MAGAAHQRGALAVPQRAPVRCAGAFSFALASALAFALSTLPSLDNFAA
jgi:hypothetical protein